MTALVPAPPGAASRVLVGLSGGVDSAVAALLLRQAGWDAQGLFLSNWDEDDDGYCTAAQDFQDARAVAAALAIPLHRASFAGESRQRVFGHFPARTSRRTHPEPRRALQPRDQVRRGTRVGAPARRHPLRDRTLRAPRRRRRW